MADDHAEALARVEARRQADLEATKRQDTERRERQRYEKTHWKELRWASESKEKFEYALWYYQKRLELFNLSWVFLLLLNAICQAAVFYEVRSLSYGWFAFLMGVARAIATDGAGIFLLEDKPRDFFDKYTSFFEKSFTSKLQIRSLAFLWGLIFGPLALLYHLFEYAYVLDQRRNPSPTVPDSDYSGSSETVVGRVAADGTIYKRD